jgi:riboflavin kinase/FMN adenylyltransferase
MRVVRWPEQEPCADRPSVVTLGVFDGVHRGHAAVIGRVIQRARGTGRQAVVVTFDRHPTTVVAERREPVITSLQHRLRLFEDMGVDLALVVVFTPRVAETSAEDFVRRVLWRRLRAKVVVLGFDCRFGRRREGDAELCRPLHHLFGAKGAVRKSGVGMQVGVNPLAVLFQRTRPVPDRGSRSCFSQSF